MTPDMAPEMTPDMTPEMTPDMTPEMTPDMTPDMEPCEDDALGENDTCEEALAQDLELDDETTIEAALCEGDTDHYSVEMLEGEVLFASVAQEGDFINMAVLDDGCGDALVELTADEGAGEVTFTAPADGNYTLSVSNVDGEEAGDYALTLVLGEDAPTCTPDDQEPNEAFDAATELSVERDSESTVEGLVMCPDDEDWFSVEVADAGDTITATLDQGDLGSDLSFDIMDTDGSSRLERGRGSESVSATAEEAGTYFVRVSTRNAPTTGTAYSLTLGVAGPAPCTPDDSEPNNDTDSAQAVGRNSSTSGNICPENDLDHYSFTANEDDTVDITMTFDAMGGQLPIGVLYGPSDQIIDFIEDGELSEGPLTVEEGGQYILEVTGSTEGVEYSLDVQVEGNVVEECGVVDVNEPNNTCEDAPILPAFTEVDGHFCGATEERDDKIGGDWFTFVVGEGQDVELLIEFFHFEGNLDAIVYEPDCDSVVEIGFSTSNDEEINMQGLSAGQYRVHVFGGPQTENDYTISVEISN